MTWCQLQDVRLLRGQPGVFLGGNLSRRFYKRRGGLVSKKRGKLDWKNKDWNQILHGQKCVAWDRCGLCRIGRNICIDTAWLRRVFWGINSINFKLQLNWRWISPLMDQQRFLSTELFPALDAFEFFDGAVWNHVIFVVCLGVHCEATYIALIAYINGCFQLSSKWYFSLTYVLSSNGQHLSDLLHEICAWMSARIDHR